MKKFGDEYFTQYFIFSAMIVQAALSPCTTGIFWIYQKNNFKYVLQANNVAFLKEVASTTRMAR